MGVDTRVIEVPGHFNWPDAAPYAHGVQAGQFLFVGGQVALDAQGHVVGPGDIEAQTRAAFENVTKVLRAAGADWRNVVTMNTFYDQDAEGPQVEEGWKRMTQVRLEFLHKPAGPCGTGLRAKLPLPDLMIQVEVVAVLPPGHDQRIQLMPEQLWDWPIPGPFTQGWQVGDYVFVGGQISADRAFNVLGQNNLEAQSRNVSDNIGSVLRLGGTRLGERHKAKGFLRRFGLGNCPAGSRRVLQWFGSKYYRGANPPRGRRLTARDRGSGSATRCQEGADCSQQPIQGTAFYTWMADRRIGLHRSSKWDVEEWRMEWTWRPQSTSAEDVCQLRPSACGSRK